jgi:hypothetical protein
VANNRTIPAKIQQAVIADRASGLSTIEIGKKYELHRVTVSRICSGFKKSVPNSELAAPAEDYRTRLKVKSIKALDAALDCGQDNYKRGGIAIQVMKGIGEFQEVSFIGVQVGLAEPSTWRTTYRTPIAEGTAINSEDSGD